MRSQAKAIPGHGPMLLPSYPTVGRNAGKLRALQNVAFVYDNAVAGIALTACNAPKQARRIADALLQAPSRNPTYHDGRLRNAYRAGAIHRGKVQLPGYWDQNAGYWKQDAYQVGTASGNMAWAALLLLTVYHHTHDARYLHAAVAKLHWIDMHTYGKAAPAGYEGGRFGFDGKQRVQHWKSIEHNIDIHAAAVWALHAGSDATLTRERKITKQFVSAMWNRHQHRFYIGTLDDGTTISRQHSALDAELWPLLAFHPRPEDWIKVWTWVSAQNRQGAGYGYRRHPVGVWTEGTAQAADAMLATDKPVPDALWTLLLAQRSKNGMLFATPQKRIGTNLAIGPDSTTADFYYYHLPHLGATAWAVLAAKAWNPFTGKTMTPRNQPETTHP